MTGFGFTEKESSSTPDPWGQTDSWLGCLPWDGEERSLPAGEYTKVPGFQAASLVKRWKVLDVESDEGYRVVKRAELKHGDIIIGAIMNENSIQAVAATYGKRFIVFTPADRPNVKLDRGQWRDEFGTDALELEALKQIRKEL